MEAILKIEKDLEKGFLALIALVPLTEVFSEQIKTVEKWQKK